MGVVEAEKVVPETLFGDELDVQILGGFEGLHGIIGGDESGAMAMEPERGNAEEASPQGLLHARGEVEAGGGE